MSIRNRVMLATLGLAVVGFVVTLGAQDDKIIIVRDGSVEVFVNNSHFRPKDDEGKQKWSKGADRVQVFEDTDLAACTTPVKDPLSNSVEFNKVVLKIADRDNKNAIVDIPAANEGFLKKLTLEPPSEWQFVFKKYGHRLVFGTTRPNPNVKLQQVVVTDKANNETTYPATPSTKTILCVVFRD
jgi:hypothetical protein